MSVVGGSKVLSWILRHGAVQSGLTVESDGYVRLDKLMKLDKMKGYTLEDIEKIVKENDKNRFSLKTKGHDMYIRANQGHSLEVASFINEEELMTLLDKPLDMIVHGTTYDAIEIIKKDGLKPMARSHIHFAINDDLIEGNKAQSGIRRNCEVKIYIDMEKAMSDGMKFYISDNKAVLSKGIDGCIDPKYFKNIVYCEKRQGKQPKDNKKKNNVKENIIKE